MTDEEHPSGFEGPRIAVVDDPVSSLDSEVLYVVTELVVDLINQALRKETSVKQVMLLTHNAYFHHAVTHAVRKDSRIGDSAEKIGFWRLRKAAGKTFVDACASNPIRTSYELLWRDFVEAQSASTDVSATLPITLRRILEYYFELLGGISLRNLPNREGWSDEERPIVRALLRWSNEGAHASALGELTSLRSQRELEQMCSVFEQVFRKSGHDAHFDMMVKRAEDLEARLNDGGN